MLTLDEYDLDRALFAMTPEEKKTICNRWGLKTPSFLAHAIIEWEGLGNKCFLDLPTVEA